jgi:hypothetical protein
MPSLTYDWSNIQEENGLKKYTGIIESISDSDREWLQSPWEAIKCRYYNENGELEIDTANAEATPGDILNIFLYHTILS